MQHTAPHTDDATLHLINVIDGKIDTLINKVDSLGNSVSVHSVDIALLNRAIQGLPAIHATVEDHKRTFALGKRMLAWTAALVPFGLGLVELWRILNG